MPVWTAFATIGSEAGAEALGEALERMDPAGVGVFEMEDGSGLWEVGGYFEGAPDLAGLALLEAVHGVRFVISELPETDWVAKVRRDLAPVEAGRFFVHGGHDADRIPEGRVALLIEAAMAFGTGHHGTTQGCLRALDRLLVAGAAPARVADIGCGTAVLAMAAARVWPGAEVVASDIDPVAVEVAQANVAANGLADRVACVLSDGAEHPVLDGPFDLILANILMGPLIDLAPALSDRLSAGGRLVLSGLLTGQAETVAAAYRGHGLDLVAREDIGDWATLVMGVSAG